MFQNNFTMGGIILVVVSIVIGLILYSAKKQMIKCSNCNKNYSRLRLFLGCPHCGKQ